MFPKDNIGKRLAVECFSEVIGIFNGSSLYVGGHPCEVVRVWLAADHLVKLLATESRSDNDWLANGIAGRLENLGGQNLKVLELFVIWVVFDVVERGRLAPRQLLESEVRT